MEKVLLTSTRAAETLHINDVKPCCVQEGYVKGTPCLYQTLHAALQSKKIIFDI